jgi:hypothetical protein
MIGVLLRAIAFLLAGNPAAERPQHIRRQFHAALPETHELGGTWKVYNKYGSGVYLPLLTPVIIENMRFDIRTDRCRVGAWKLVRGGVQPDMKEPTPASLSLSPHFAVY